MSVLDSLLTEANKMLVEVRDERDRARQEVADLRTALTDSQLLADEMLTELELIDRVGRLGLDAIDMARISALITRAQGGS